MSFCIHLSAWRDSNSHVLANTRFLVWAVYQFQHIPMVKIPLYLLMNLLTPRQVVWMSPWVPSHHLTSTDDTFLNSTSDDFKNTSSLIRCLVYIYFHQCKNLRLNLGGGDWNRTSDTSVFSAMLYQLSYSTINFHIVKDLYHSADEGSRTHTPSLIPGSEPSVATITPHPHFIGYYILFTPSMHCFNLIEPISSPCLILQ